MQQILSHLHRLLKQETNKKIEMQDVKLLLAYFYGYSNYSEFIINSITIRNYSIKKNYFNSNSNLKKELTLLNIKNESFKKIINHILIENNLIILSRKNIKKLFSSLDNNIDFLSILSKFNKNNSNIIIDMEFKIYYLLYRISKNNLKVEYIINNTKKSNLTFENENKKQIEFQKNKNLLINLINNIDKINPKYSILYKFIFNKLIKKIYTLENKVVSKPNVFSVK